MTTIATDGKSMAGDGKSQTRGTVCSLNSVKVHRMRDGGLFAACGSSGWGDKLQAWYEDGQSGSPPTGEDGDGFILLRLDGSIWQGGQDGLAVQIEAPFAIGSGMDLAIGAMDQGASPEQAVAIAAQRDPGTGGTITILHLESQT